MEAYPGLHRYSVKGGVKSCWRMLNGGWRSEELLGDAEW